MAHSPERKAAKATAALKVLAAALFGTALLSGCVYEKDEPGARPEREVRRETRPEVGRDTRDTGRPQPSSVSQPTRIHPKD